jgi:hypothetical protein
LSIIFFYILKKQPTLVLRDIITSLEVKSKSNSKESNITICLIPTSVTELLFTQKSIIYLDSIFNQIYNNGYKIKYSIDGTEYHISISIFSISNFKIFKIILNSIIASFQLFAKYYLVNLNFKKILYSKYKDIQYGDISASTVFRNKNMFQLVKNLEFIKESFRLTSFIQLVNHVAIKYNSDKLLKYFSVLDFTYSEAILLRILPKNNFIYIETQDYKNENLLINSPELYYYPWVARAVNNYNIDNSIIVNYYNSRLYNPHEVLDYMWMGTNNNNSNAVQLDNGTNFIEYSEKQYAVLFLHAFSDAAFCYGLDGFKDLMDWTLTTINILLENNKIDKILIKPHPNISFDYYPADQNAMLYLKSYFSNNEKVLFLAKNCSLIAICNLKNIIGITRHGSVAEEMTYLNKPVIAYRYGPWKNYHNFLITWENKIHYKKILLNLDFKQIYNHPIDHKKSLYNYFFEYRKDSRNISRGWYDVLYKLQSDNEFIGNFENIKKLDSIIFIKKVNGALEYLLNNNAININ